MTQAYVVTSGHLGGYERGRIITSKQLEPLGVTTEDHVQRLLCIDAIRPATEEESREEKINVADSDVRRHLINRDSEYAKLAAEHSLLKDAHVRLQADLSVLRDAADPDLAKKVRYDVEAEQKNLILAKDKTIADMQARITDLERRTKDQPKPAAKG